MVQIRVVRGFRDLKHHKPRRPGDTFEDTLERAEQIASALPGYIEFAAEREAEPEREAALDSLTVAQLKALCDERGIEYPKRARKAELLALLEG